MSRSRSLWMTGFAATLLLAHAASAQDCPRGDLDVRYCDADGDLVADTPTDPSQLVDPDTLIFAYTPVEDPAVYRTAWSDFLDHMKEVTGKEVVFFPVQSNAAQIEAMRSGRLHVAGFNTGSNPLAVNCAGFVPFTIMAARTATSATRWRSSPIRAAASRRSRTSRARPWPSPRRPRTPASRRRPPCSRPSSTWSPSATSRPPSPASTTTRSWASPTRTTMPPRSPTRAHRMISAAWSTTGSQDDLQLPDLPDHRLRLRQQPHARAAGEDQGGLLRLRLGGHHAAGGVLQVGEAQFIPITYQDPLGRDPQDRRRQRRVLRLPVTLP